MAITLLGDVRFLLEIAPRLGDATDEPEGARYIQLSDTLVTEMVKLLAQYELGLRKPEIDELIMLTKEDIRRLDLVVLEYGKGEHAEGAVKWLHLSEETIGTIICALEFMMDNVAPFDEEDKREFGELIERLLEVKGESDE